MSCFKIQINKFTNQGSNREAGVKLRDFLIEQLAVHNFLELDLTDVLLTPSVADEAFGILARMLGKDRFLEKIKFTNISQAQKAIIIHVISRRLSV
jgi:hypothetical protein